MTPGTAGARRSDERYQRLMAATRAAARQGYDSVSMRELARAAQVSMTTIYEYCSSKDHLIAEAHLEWMERVRAQEASGRRRGRTARARLLAYVREMTAAWDEHEALMRTLLRTLYSLDPGVRDVRAALSTTHASIMASAIGDAPIAEPEAVIEIIGEVIDSVTFRWVSGAIDTDDARRALERTVVTLLPG